MDILFVFQPLEIDKKYSGILEKKWTSVIRLQKKVCAFSLLQLDMVKAFLY